MRCFTYTFLLAGIVFILGSMDGTAREGGQPKSCLDCHSSQTYTVYNEWTERDERRLMNPLYILDTVRLAIGVHNTFNCIDCHAMDYETYPHNAELKLEPMMSCIDCHGGDETYASWKFDEIEAEFHKSVHFQQHGEYFSCSKCHDQHYYHPTARNSNSLREIVEANNNMCLSCHDNMVRYQLVSDEQNPQIVEIHNWLPNQALHFRRVRCIECHTQVQDSLLVSHNILAKEFATRNCVECHSSNSLLQASLYKYQNLKSRNTEGEQQRGVLASIGSVNSSMQDEYYLIGASRIPFLNFLYGIILFGTLAGIIVHAVFRILKKE